MALLAVALPAFGATAESYARQVSSLIDPGKLATLGKRGANQRVQKYVAILADARAAGVAPDQVASTAVSLVGMKGDTAKLTADAMTRNLTIAERLGCLDGAGLRDMRKGQSPTIRKGPYTGDQLSVDHIVPLSVAPELDRTIANLELMPLRMNLVKRDLVGDRQVDLALKLNKAGLLSDGGLKAVLSRAR